MNKQQQQKMKDTEKTVLEYITKHNVLMHSRYYFILRSALLILATFLMFGLTLLVISLIIISTRASGIGALAFFGFSGWSRLLLSLPWVLILIVIVIFILLEILSTYFSFVYRRPLIYSILALTMVTIGGGIIIAATPLHERAFTISHEHDVPLMKTFYRNMIVDSNGIHIGSIESIENNILTILDREGIIYYVHLSDTTRRPQSLLATGMVVMVLGDNKNGVVEAIGIRPLKRRIPFMQKQDTLLKLRPPIKESHPL